MEGFSNRKEGPNTAAELTILNPVAQLASDLGEPPSAPQRPRTLEGRRVGLYWNRKPGGNFALERFEGADRLEG